MLGTRKLALKTSVATTWSWRECVVSRALLWSLMVRILAPIWCNLKQKDKGRQKTAAQGRRAFSHRTRKNHHGLITKLTGIFHLLFFQYELGIIYNWLKHLKLVHLALQKDHLAGQCDSTRGTTPPQAATQHTVPLWRRKQLWWSGAMLPRTVTTSSY